MTVSRRGVLLLPVGALAQSGQDVRVLRIFYAINKIRREHNLAALRWNDRAEAAARDHASNMVRRGFFGHQDPVLGRLTDRLARFDIDWTNCGENIFEEKGYRDLAAAAVQGWMNSPGHRENILRGVFTETGIGLATRRDGTNVVDQIFIRPRRVA